MFFAWLGCADVTRPETTNAEEVVTTVTLHFEGPTTFDASWTDPESDGDPVVDALSLGAGASYAVSVTFLNEASSPAVDLTEEIANESDQHQVFYTGGSDFLAYAYGDEDENGLPVGLDGTVDAIGPGEGTWTVTLRHLPPVDGTDVKVADLAVVAQTDGISALPGASDASVAFPVVVR